MKKYVFYIISILIASMILITGTITIGCKSEEEKLIDTLEEADTEEELEEALNKFEKEEGKSEQEYLWTKEYIDTTPEQIYEEFSAIDNIIKKESIWQEDYFGKRVQWSADLASLNIVDDYIIGSFHWPSMYGRSQSKPYGAWHLVYVIFRNSEEELLSELSEGDTVLFEGSLIHGPDVGGDEFEKLKLPIMVELAIDGGIASLIDGVIVEETSSTITNPPIIAIDNFDLRAEKAISWAINNLGRDHWYELCLRFVANAYMQQGNPPNKVPEGVWDSAFDAINGDQKQDLKLNDPDNWREAPKGALVFFDNTKNNPYGHVGIHMRDGQMIHSYGKVRIDTILQAQQLDQGGLIGPYVGWAYPPERWRQKINEQTLDLGAQEHSPAEVWVAFWEALKNRQYSDAEQYIEYKVSFDMDGYIKMCEADPGYLPQKVEILGEEIDEEAGFAVVTYIVYFQNGETIEGEADMVLINGIWKF